MQQLGIFKIDFNSRTHVECDAFARRIHGAANHFNSRTHVECDLSVLTSIAGLPDFNSRTHVECDCKLQKMMCM